MRTYTKKELLDTVQRSLDAYNKAIAENDKIEADHRIEQYYHWKTFVEVLTGRHITYNPETGKAFYVMIAG